MDDPPFYRDDLQTTYDGHLATGKEPAEALKLTKEKYELKKIEVTPTGEVRSPGVVDNPDPPTGSTPPPKKEEPPEEPSGEEEPEPGSQMGSEDPSGGAPPPPKKEEADEEAPRLTLLEARAVLEGETTGERRLRRHTDARGRERAEVYERFQRLVNMRPVEIRSHLRSPELAAVLERYRRRSRASKTEGIRLGQKMAGHIMQLKNTPVEGWDEQMWERCHRVNKYIEGLRRTPAPVLDEQGQPTRKLLTLRTWGHNPLQEAVLDEAAVIVQQRTVVEKDWICPHCNERIGERGHLFYGGKDGEKFVAHDEVEEPTYYHRQCGGVLELPESAEESVAQVNRLIDATATQGPVLICEYVPGRGPKFDTLKKNKVELEPGERQQVMDRGATWNHGHIIKKGSPERHPSPAVWKSIVDGVTWFVTNTHRAYNVTKTLVGAIGRYHAFIKSTA